MATDATDLDGSVAVFTAARPRLFGIAYRMLGSVSEAEDIVQDTWLKWQPAERDSIRNPEAFLTTITTRLSINAATSARRTRETYVGPWLPDPVDTHADPSIGAENRAGTSVAVLLLLETLTPRERAAYVLREAFEYPYSRIADVVGTTETATRQLVSRARTHLRTVERNPVDPADQSRLLEAFIAAARVGDLARLESLLAEDVVSRSDGGGVVRASKFSVVGRNRVAKFVRAFADRFWADTTVTPVHANGQSAVVVSRDGVVCAAITVEVSDALIDTVLWQMNPAKLSGFAATP